MKPFIFLFRGEDQQPDLSAEEMQRHMQEWGAWIEDLTRTGRFESGTPLEGAGKIVSGRTSTATDDPFQESREVVNGYLVISARDIDEAVEIAKACPILDVGGHVEVRAVQTMNA